MGMIQTDDFLIRVTKVCPSGFNFNIRNKIELTIFINGSFRNLVAGTECKLFIELLTGNGFPVTAYINRFSISGTVYILEVLLCHFKPIIRAFPAKVSLDNEKAACIHQNSNVVDGVIAGIKAYLSVCDKALLFPAETQPSPSDNAVFLHGVRN